VKKIKVVHIHDDSKFLSRTNRFDDDRFDNLVVFIGSSKWSNNKRNTVKNFSEGKKDVDNIIRYCNSADLVVIYDLNFIKSYIVNRIPSNVKIGWTFFGYELYKRMPETVYSKKSLSFLPTYQNPNYSGLKYFYNQAKSSLKKIIFWQTTIEKEFYNAINRIDYFFLLSDYEYNFLKSFWPNLPLFFQAPATKYGDDNLSFSYKTDDIIIGNNRSPYNNHLDVLDVISTIKNKNNIQFKMFLSYGPSKHYYKVVRERANEINEVGVIDEFLKMDEFENIYKKASAFVMNGYRQMAFGNIFMGLRNGVKVYLNSKNIYYHWLLKEGFLIYDVKDLACDIENNEYKLSYNQMRYNFNQCDVLSQKYNVNDFRDNIFKVLTSNS